MAKQTKQKKIDLSSLDTGGISLGDVFALQPGMEPLAQFAGPFASPREETVSIAKGAQSLDLSVPLRLTLERKGRGGKTVTVLSGLVGSDEAQKSLLKELKNSLGCGGTVEDSQICFQGDQRERLAALLKKQGAKKIRIG